MSDSATIELRVQFTTGRRGRKQAHSPPTIAAGPDAITRPQGRLPRVTKLMALAIRFQGYVDAGEVTDYAELARLGQVTRARMSQIMNLLHLALDIQQALLELPRVVQGRDGITERDLRPIAAVVDWQAQRQMWQALLPRISTAGV